MFHVAASNRSSRLLSFLTQAACVSCAAAVIGLASVAAAQQGAEKVTAEQVAGLVKELDSAKASARQSAQDSLVKIGSDVLEHLPAEDAANLSAEQKRRLTEIRAALSKQASVSTLKPGTVTLDAKSITLSDAIAAIQKQTGNQIIDLREEFGQEITNPDFSVEWKDTPFWKAMDEIAEKTGVSPYLFSGDRQVGLVTQPRAARPVTYAGPLRISLNQIYRRIQFENNRKECVLELELAWEPRVRPILFEMKPEQIEVKDDLDRPLAAETQTMMEGFQEETNALRAAVDSSMIRTDFIIHLAQPQKGAIGLKHLRGKLDVVMPANIQSFDFSDLAKAKDVKREKGNVAVVLEKFAELDDGLWAADVLLEFESDGEAFESYETWFYDNEAFLQKADGTRFAQNGGITLTESDGGRVGIQYRFVDAPGKMSDYRLIYRTPSTIVRDSIPFEFTDIELP